VPVDAAEKGVLLDFAGTTEAAETVLGVADQAMERLATNKVG
jgi:hypothetical protein